MIPIFCCIQSPSIKSPPEDTTFTALTTPIIAELSTNYSVFIAVVKITVVFAR